MSGDAAKRLRSLQMSTKHTRELLCHPEFGEPGMAEAFVESNPGPLAEFLTAQLRLGDPELACAERSAWAQRESELIEGHFSTWLGPRAERVDKVAEPGMEGLDVVCFRNVFETEDLWTLRSARLVPCPGVISAGDYVRYGDELAEHHQSTALIIDGLFEAAAVHPQRLEFMRSVAPDQCHDESGAIELANCRTLSSITDITLRSYNLGDERTAKIIGSPHLHALENLAFVYHRHSKAALEGLRNRAKGRLRSLQFIRLDDQDGESPLGDEALGMLAAMPSLSGLERLDVPFTKITSAGILEILRSPHLDRLAHLDAGDVELGDAAGFQLASAPDLARLRSLRLWEGIEQDSALQQLLNCEHLVQLRELQLGGLELSSNTPPVCLPELQRLSLPCAKLNGAGLKRFIEHSALARLRSLDLEACPLQERDVESLAGAAWFHRLEELHLGDVELSERGMQILLDGVHDLRHLRIGGLHQSAPSARGLSFIADCPRLARLNCLDLRNAAEADEALARRLVDSPHLDALTHLAWPCVAGFETLQKRWGPRVCLGGLSSMDDAWPRIIVPG